MKGVLQGFLVMILWVAISFADEPLKLGKEITLTDTVAIGNILANPEAFVGKKVLVKGKIVGVCDRMGCWIDLVGKTDAEKIRVKVKDGEIVFPQESKGRVALVEGEVEKLEYTREEAIKYKEHHAKEHGEPFDPSTVTGPMTIYRIKGLGIVIE
ncbi:MAG: DUF4920 domain-containing protein [Calditrichaeota bacterium]|nr:DUF4920 domain-containing protein [Calditrichota bacterium]